MTYVTALLFILLLCFALYNHIVFLLRPFTCSMFFEQISLFYLLAELTICLRVITIILWYYLYDQNRIILVAVQPLLQLNVGLLQAWMIIELIVRIGYDTRSFENINSPLMDNRQ